MLMILRFTNILVSFTHLYISNRGLSMHLAEVRMCLNYRILLLQVVLYHYANYVSYLTSM